MSYEHLKLKVLIGSFKYVLIDDHSELVKLASKTSKSPVAIFMAEDELAAIVPNEVSIEGKKEEGWSCIRVVGEMPFGTVQGLIATIGATLKQENIGMCVVSTFLTDWFFIKTKNVDGVVNALEKAGWNFEK